MYKPTHLVIDVTAVAFNQAFDQTEGQGCVIGPCAGRKVEWSSVTKPRHRCE